jgi:hypothetical protein
VNAFSISSPRTRLFLVSFLILFLELACIRWFGSAVIFLTFFTNIILMACFLGMSVGLLSAKGRFDFTRWTLPLLYIAFILAYIGLMLYQSFSHLNIDVGGQGSPQQIFFGTEYRANDPSKISVPIELIAGIFFLLIALTFVGLGQIMGRAFNAIPDRIAAYTADIAGSICGIVCFGLCSYFQFPPLLWFGVAVVIYLFLLGIGPTLRATTPDKSGDAGNAPRNSLVQRPIMQYLAAIGLLVLAALPDPGNFARIETYWSPYYKINYWPSPAFGIYTNNIGHQEMKNVATRGPAYVLPHLLNRDAGNPPFKDVLIIGAGSGNDVQGARMFRADRIDAVEIDPVIQRLGMRDHPDQPYSDPSVIRHNDDGRSFVKKTDKKYDLVVYALVDSLVLHSGYSSLRLESFLFTRQAMQDIKARLKPGGVFAMYNFYRQGWVVQRLVKLGEEVFGHKPIVFSLPHRDSIAANDSQSGTYTFILCGDTSKIEQKLANNGSFWLNSVPALNDRINGYSRQAPTPKIDSAQFPPKMLEEMNPRWQRIAPAQVDVSQTTLLPDDNWPFLYLRDQAIPALNVRGMLLIGVLSLLLLWLIGVRGWNQPAVPEPSTPASATQLKLRSFNWQMFFLGAGFMLLETKSVVHMALLFGSTWIVNSFVFGAILLMILLSNLWVAKTNPRNVVPYYILLVITLLIGLLVPMNTFLALPGAMKVLASCAITFIPIFFAGVAFSSAFRKSAQPDVDFGCNVVGIILGGLCENLSLAIGFNGLLGLAMLFYVLSFVLKPREDASSSSPEVIG